MFECEREKKSEVYYHIGLEDEDEKRKYGIWSNGILTETISMEEIRREEILRRKYKGSSEKCRE